MTEMIRAGRFGAEVQSWVFGTVWFGFALRIAVEER
jgi:hypothetical protein